MPSQRWTVRDLAAYGHARVASLIASELSAAPEQALATESRPERVVLVHGTLDRAAGMLRVARRLREFEIVRYDRRGYGRSANTGPAVSFAQQLDDLAAVLDNQPSVVFGHSYGGVLALALAAQRHPNVAAVVSYEAPRAWEPWWTPPPQPGLSEAEAAEQAEQFSRALMGEDVWLGLPETTRQQRRSEGPAMVAELRHQSQRQYEAANIGVPVLIGVGELSGPRTQRAAKLTSDEAPYGELHTIPGAGHGAPFSHPEAVAGLVRRAFDRAEVAP